VNSRLTALKAKARHARQTHAYRAEGASIRFTEYLVAAVKSSHLTRSALAGIIGTSPANVIKILKGETNFALDSMARIANALNCEPTIGLQPLATAVSGSPPPRSRASYRQIAPLPSSVLNETPRLTLHLPSALPALVSSSGPFFPATPFSRPPDRPSS